MPDNTHNNTERRTIDITPKFDRERPFTFLGFAVHLGIPVWREEDVEENLRRVRRLLQVYIDHDKPLLMLESGEPFTPEQVTPELIAQHTGAVVNCGTHTPASFDDHMLDVIASITGIPRLSYYRIRKHNPMLGRPCDIYQEVCDKTDEERRRVEVYLDGGMLWVEDNYEGTGETGSDWGHFPGLYILNERPGQTATQIDADTFEVLWEKATRAKCLWTIFTGPDTVKDCPAHRLEGMAFCAEHTRQARAMFPRLFEEV